MNNWRKFIILREKKCSPSIIHFNTDISIEQMISTHILLSYTASRPKWFTSIFYSKHILLLLDASVMPAINFNGINF